MQNGIRPGELGQPPLTEAPFEIHLGQPKACVHVAEGQVEVGVDWPR